MYLDTDGANTYQHGRQGNQLHRLDHGKDKCEQACRGRRTQVEFQYSKHPRVMHIYKNKQHSHLPTNHTRQQSPKSHNHYICPENSRGAGTHSFPPPHNAHQIQTCPHPFHCQPNSTPSPHPLPRDHSGSSKSHWFCSCFKFPIAAYINTACNHLHYITRSLLWIDCKNRQHLWKNEHFSRLRSAFVPNTTKTNGKQSTICCPIPYLTGEGIFHSS